MFEAWSVKAKVIERNASLRTSMIKPLVCKRVIEFLSWRVAAGSGCVRWKGSFLPAPLPSVRPVELFPVPVVRKGVRESILPVSCSSSSFYYTPHSLRRRLFFSVLLLLERPVNWRGWGWEWGRGRLRHCYQPLHPRARNSGHDSSSMRSHLFPSEPILGEWKATRALEMNYSSTRGTRLIRYTSFFTRGLAPCFLNVLS